MRQRVRSVLDASLSNVVFFGVFVFVRIFWRTGQKKDPPKNKTTTNNQQQHQQQQKQQINNHKSTTQLKINYNQ